MPVERTLPHSERHRRRGFTLIELLVVIAIVAALLGILLPALGGVRKTAQAVKCSSNMRQVALGWATYANDNDDISIPGQMGRYSDEAKNVYFVGNGYQYRPRWYVTMGAAPGSMRSSSRGPSESTSTTCR